MSEGWIAASIMSVQKGIAGGAGILRFCQFQAESAGGRIRGRGNRRTIMDMIQGWKYRGFMMFPQFQRINAFGGEKMHNILFSLFPSCAVCAYCAAAFLKAVYIYRISYWGTKT